MNPMKESGCTRIGSGMESANPVVLRNMKKRITVEKASQAVRLAKEVGLVAPQTRVGEPHFVRDVQLLRESRQVDLTETASLFIS
ncbi:MAG: hypothetical protein LN415_00450 [Candidatus Thermoplasmatota archaeon]|nr:hypothetical protein [Candidatus Thermoplasmatota archaeon]